MRSSSAGSTRPSRSAPALQIDATAYRLVHGEADLPPVAHRRSLRRFPGGPGAVAGHGPADAAGAAHPPGPARTARHPGEERPAHACARGARAEGRGARRRVCRRPCPIRELGIEYEVDLRHGQKTGLFLDQRENRAAAAPTRAAACSTASATTAASRWRWPAAATRRSRSTSPRTRSHGRRPTPRATVSSSTRASAMCSTSCAASSAWASASTRSCWIRQRSRRARSPSRRRPPATRRSTSAR